MRLFPGFDPADRWLPRSTIAARTTTPGLLARFRVDLGFPVAGGDTGIELLVIDVDVLGDGDLGARCAGAIGVRREIGAIEAVVVENAG